MNATAWSYAAVSSSPQETSLAEQERWARDVADANGWTITRTFSGTASGRHGVRRVLEELLTELSALPKAQRPARILMIRLDRTGRMALETIAALAQIKRLGVTLHTRQDGDVKLESAIDALRPIFELVTAEIENSARSDKMRAVHAKWRGEGRHLGPAPYGTEKDAQKRLIVKEPQASFVRKAFELRAAGAGYIRIAREVGRFAPPQGSYAGMPRSTTWHQQSVSKLLSCASYRGLVVPEELFDRVQTIRNPDWRLTRPSRVYPWPLSSVLRCWCGWTMAGVASGQKDRRTRYYSCRHPRYHGFDTRPSLRAETAEAWFLGRLRGFVASPTLVDDARRTSNGDRAQGLRERLAIDEAERESVERQRAAAWDLQGDQRISVADLSQRLQTLGERHATLVESIADVKRELAVETAQDSVAIDTAPIIARAAATWESAAWEDQKEIARIVAIVLEGVFYQPDGSLKFGTDGDVLVEQTFSIR